MVRNTALTLSLIALVSLGLHSAQAAADGDEDCTDCSDADRSSRTITLLTPGTLGSEWLGSDHPGAEALRKGEPCSQCHQGKERELGEKIAQRGQTASRDIDVSFSADQERLHLTLTWQASTNPQRAAVMWGNGGNAAFSSSGCWASCHSDMSGMSEDSDQQQGKYLKVARSELSTGFKLAPGLQALRDAGDYVEIWQVATGGADEASAAGGTVLEQINWYERHPLSAEAKYDKGRWRVTFSRPLEGGPGGSKSFLPGKKYNFGIALQGSQEEARAHWVSLPMSFSLDGDDTDFTVGRE